MTVGTGFDEGYRRWGASEVHAELFGEGLGLPAAVQPFSFVPVGGLREVATLVATSAGQTLVDLGCGRGGPGLWLAARTGARLIGVDISAVAIADARRRRALFNDVTAAEFRVGDAAATGLPAGCADAVVTIDVLQLLDEPVALLREVARLLRPGGRLVVTTWEGRGEAPPRFPRSLPALFEHAGLRVDVHAERPDWLRRQLRIYQRAVDGADAAVRDLAREGRRWRAWHRDVRRVIVRARPSA
ncbi:MAG: class I SAM-dependent methyltransferase [Pseudonocardiaceae bacterium]